MFDSDFLAEQKKKLETLLVQLEAKLAEVHMHTEVGEDAEDEQLLEYEVDAEADSVIHLLKHRISLVKRALEKIADGTYGVTDDKQKIRRERLEAVPEADTVG